MIFGNTLITATLLNAWFALRNKRSGTVPLYHSLSLTALTLCSII